jgi:hypothetical protein
MNVLTLVGAIIAVYWIGAWWYILRKRDWR